jgi:phosphoglycerol transferase MdoB-like AlkP superfamily enzyme
MRKILLFTVKYFIFWILLYVVGKVFFTIYQQSLVGDISYIEILLSLVHGLLLDASITGYVMMLILLLFIVLAFSTRILTSAIDWITYLLLSAVCFLIIADFELYRNWGFHIDTTPLLYISTPKEMLASVKWYMLAGLLLSVGIFAGTAIWLYRKHVRLTLDSKRLKWHNLPFVIFLMALTFIPVRGGFSIAPINVGRVYFSEKQFANHIAVNPAWNFFYSAQNHSKLSASFDNMPINDAKQIVADIHKEEGISEKVLNTDKPNVVVLILESFSAKVIESLGGLEGVTPNFDKLVHEGILFDKFFAGAERSDKGLVAILSGMPSVPVLSMNKFPQKTQNFNFLSQEFENEGYRTSFFHGGNINFANLKSFIYNAGFDEIVTMDDFDPEYYNSKWGVHDHIMLDTLFTNIENEKSPFFKVLFTLSSHEPFDVPMEDVFKGDEVEQFKNSVYYTDKCLGDFFQKAKKSDWWDNTLFVLVADHGSRHPEANQPYEISKYRIPMLWLGGALAKKDTVVSRYGSQIDISRTVLNQIDLDNKEFTFSKDLFADSINSFAFFAYNNGFGFLSDSITQIYDNISNSFIETSGMQTKSDSLLGKAYQQVIWDDFMSK